MPAQRASVFLFAVLNAIPSFAKTHFLVWFKPRSLSPANRESLDRSAATQIEPMRGLTFLTANLVLLSVIEMIVFDRTPPFELPPPLLPFFGIFNALPVFTIMAFVVSTAVSLLIPFCFLKLVGHAVSIRTLFRVLCYESALPTGATIIFFYLPLLLLPREEIANLHANLIWPVIATGLFSFYWIARQLKFEGGSGGVAIYLGMFAATAALSGLGATPVWPIETYNNGGASMLPTVQDRDYVLANKWAYLWRRPKRGEIAVFRGPMDPHVPYLKRVIGLPGDQIQFKQSILHINGVPAERTRLPDFVLNPGTHAERHERQYAESLKWDKQAGTNILIRPSYRILETSEDTGRLDNTPVYSVPNDHYFVVGDNRDRSLDSRVMNGFGFVPESHFVAPVYRRLLPPTNLAIQASTE